MLAARGVMTMHHAHRDSEASRARFEKMMRDQARQRRRRRMRAALIVAATAWYARCVMHHHGDCCPCAKAGREQSLRGRFHRIHTAAMGH